MPRPLVQTPVTADLGNVAVTDLILQNCALDVQSLQSFLLDSLSLTSSELTTAEILISLSGGGLATDSSRIATSANVQGVRFTPTASLKLVSAIVDGGTVQFQGGALFIGANAFIRFSLRAAVAASGGLTVLNELSQVDVPATATQLAVSAGNISVGPSGRIFAGHVFLAAGEALAVEGLLGADPASAFRDAPADPCASGLPGEAGPPAVDAGAPCTPGAADAAAGFPMWLTAPAISVLKSGLISAPALRVCAGVLSLAPGGAISARKSDGRDTRSVDERHVMPFSPANVPASS